jgi:hypothetical protein
LETGNAGQIPKFRLPNLNYMTMFADYERLVLEDYQRKKNRNKLSSGLIHPTPAKIKKECVRLCKGEIQKKDEKVIREFCEEWDNTKTSLQSIDKCDVDKFRPLLNFLKGETTATDPKNIHLLAWLIDFPFRPFEHGKRYESLTDTEVGVEAPWPLEEATIEASTSPENPSAVNFEKKNVFTEDKVGAERSDAGAERIIKEPVKCGNLSRPNDVVRATQPDIVPVKIKGRFRKVAVIGALLTVMGISGYWWWDTRQQAYITPGNGGCMYWATDHFQPIPCNQKISNTLVVALDSARVKNFKKINRPDTITNRAKGSVWYSKIDKKIEFFTADGEHPVFIGRRLKPITDYIIDKYIHPGMSLNQ